MFWMYFSFAGVWGSGGVVGVPGGVIVMFWMYFSFAGVVGFILVKLESLNKKVK